MPEKKTAKTRQRVLTIHDEKKQEITFNDIRLQLPATQWDEEPTRYYKANKQWAKLIEGMLLWLATPTAWQDATEDDYAGIVQILEYLRGIDPPTYSLDSFDDCEVYDMSFDVSTFYPNDPFDNSVSGQVIFPLKWERWGTIKEYEEFPDWMQFLFDALGDFAGYGDNDIFLIADELEEDFYSQIIAIYNSLTDWRFFPRVNIRVSGTGIVQIKFLQVPLGGSVFLWWDVEPTIEDFLSFIQDPSQVFENFSLIELTMDVFSLPPELEKTRLSEIKFEEDGEHIIGCVFIPRLNDEIPFIYPFGGIREIRVCDNLEVLTQGNKIVDRSTLRSGAIMATIDDICKGMICAAEEIAQRILFAVDNDNIRADIEVDKTTGKVTAKLTSGAAASTVDGTDQEITYGQAYQQAYKIAELFSNINSYVTKGYASTTAQGLSRKYVLISPDDDAALITAWDNAVDAYFTANPQLVIDADELALRIYCEGIVTAPETYAIDDAEMVEANLLLFTNIVGLIPSSTLGDWSDEGRAKPRTGFTGAECYTFPPVSLTVTYEQAIENAYHYFDFSGKSNRLIRLKIEVLAPYTDASGNRYDGIYYRQTSGDIDDDDPTTLAMGSGFKFIDSDIPPFLNGIGEYFVEFNCTGISRGVRVPIALVGGGGFVPVSGSLRFTIFDLGELP